MKNILFAVIMFCTFVYPVQAEYTTYDGAITLNFHEDANSPARWLLDVTMNDLDPSDSGYFENLHFDIHVKNMPMRFTDSENNTSSDYYKMYGMYIGGLIPSPLMPEFHDPSSDDPFAVIPNSETQDTSGTFLSSINPLFIRYFEDPPDPVTWSCIVTYGKEPSPAGTNYLFFANNEREGYDMVTGDLLFLSNGGLKVMIRIKKKPLLY